MLSAVLRARGSRKPHAKLDPVSIPGDKTAPDTLRGVGLEKWNQCVEFLERLGIWSITDRDILETYCQTWQYKQEAARVLEERGLLDVDNKGNVRLSPTCRAFNDFAASLRAMSSNLGFDPTSRQRLTAKASNAAPSQDDDARFFGDAVA